MADTVDKIKLFESDDEAEEEENNHDDFKIRPEYQGPHGLEMLEMNSQLSKRFRLDERFAEDFEPEDFKKVEEENISSEVNEEKKKNMKILESILGHEVSKPVKPVDRFSKRQLIRFDPEDENASKYMKTSENVKEKLKKSKKKKNIVEEKPEDVIPISTERYIEVDPNLKDILSSSTPFSFSEQFNFEHEEDTLDFKTGTLKPNEEMEIQDVEKQKQNKLFAENQMLSSRFESTAPRSKYDRFFITEDDPRLKEGIEFFKRPKPLEQLRIKWHKRRESILELFRRKKRSSQRSHSTKVQTVQMKNMIRRNNFKK